MKKNPLISLPYKAMRLSFLYSRFVRDYLGFKFNRGVKRFDLKWGDRYPRLYDNTSAFSIDAHYVFHTAWAARVLSETRPAEHVDISSFLYFSTIVSAFIPTRFYDIRVADMTLSHFQYEYADILSLPFSDNAIPSLSCMHVVEHVGLGRYGDAIDYDGDLKAIEELRRVVAPDGDLLFVVPIGKPKICFNAHRIYSYRQIVEIFEDMTLVEFCLIEDSSEALKMIRNATESQADGQQYACGCFWFKKR